MNSAYLFLILGVVMLALAIIVLLNLAGGRRNRTMQRLLTIPRYGFAAGATEVHAAMPREPRPNILVTLVTKLGDILAQRLGALGEEEIQDHLLAAGMYTTSPRTLMGLRVVLALVLPGLGYMLVGLRKPTDFLVIILLAFAGWVLPFTIIKRRARQRLEEIDRSLPDLIDLLCVMIEAGMSFVASMRIASDQLDGPLRDEMRLTLQEQTMGLGVGEALSNLGERADTATVKSFVRGMAQGERMGISIGQIMRTLADEMRARRRAAAEEKAQKAPVLMLFPLVFLIFPAMLLILMTPAILSLMSNFKGV